MTIFNQAQKQKQLSIKMTLMMYFQSINTIIKNVKKSSGKVSGWFIDAVINHTISISKYNPLAGSSHIKLPKELNPPRKRKRLIFEIVMIMNALNCHWSDT